MMRMCIKCGSISEMKDGDKYCSDKCKRQAGQSAMGMLKKGTPPRKTFALES